MKFRYGKKSYIYDPITGVVNTLKGNPARNQELLKAHIQRHTNSVQARGFNFQLNYQAFEQYINTLTAEEKNNLFHYIYEAYLYANNSLKDYHDNLYLQTRMSTDQFFKVMAKVKRYEQYLYRILIS